MNPIGSIWQRLKEHFEPDPPGWDELVKSAIEMDKQLETQRKKNGISDEQWQSLIEQIFHDFLDKTRREQQDDRQQ